jgi:hypothetical protein
MKTSDIVIKKDKYQEAIDDFANGREHLQLLRSSRYFKHIIRKEKFARKTSLDLSVTRLYFAL